jgi:hypothetical protein
VSARAGERLGVFLGESPVGEIERRGPARYRFRYESVAVEDRGPGSIVLSASLPARELAVRQGWHRPVIDEIVELCQRRVAAVS